MTRSVYNIKKGDIVIAIGKGFQRTDKGKGLVCEVNETPEHPTYMIYWVKEARKRIWEAGPGWLKRIS